MFRHFVSSPCFLCELRSPVTPFPMWSALPPQSTMERSDSPLPIRCPSFGLVHPTLNRETAGSPRFLASLFLRATLSDPGRPSWISPMRSLCIGFRNANTVATRSIGVTRLNRLGECGLPCGPQDSLCTLRTSCSVVVDFLLHIRNTRYGWLVRPCPTGTFTLKEMPSFAWRTSDCQKFLRNSFVC